MSTYWDIACVSCEERLGIINANNKEELMEAIIDERDNIESLAGLLSRRPGVWSLELHVDSHFINLDFFINHPGHDLHPVNEYGEISPHRINGQPCTLEFCSCGRPRWLSDHEQCPPQTSE